MCLKKGHNNLSHYKQMILGIFAAQEKDRLFLWIPVLLALGIALYFGMTTEIPVWSGCICLVISGLTTYYLRKHYIVFLSTLALTIIFVGFSCAQLRSAYLHTKMLPHSVGPTQIQGRIVQLRETSKGYKIDLEDLQIARLRADFVPNAVRLHVSAHDLSLKTGQWVKAYAKLKPPSAPVSPGGFDFQRHAYFQGIGAIGFVYGSLDLLPQQARKDFSFFEQLRRNIQKRIKDVFPAPHQTDQRNLAIAFLTGNKSMISEETHESVRAAGLAHLLAISGLHIGLISLITFTTVRFFMALSPYMALNLPIKKMAAVAALIAALFFTLLTGASIPTVRALMMCAVVLLGVMADRKALSLRTVAWAAIALLLTYPESLLSPSFQLSFAAVTALVAYFEERNTQSASHSVSGYFRGIFLSSLIASLATLPFAAFHFNRIALYGVGANLVAIPLTVFWVMPMGLLSFLLMPLGWESFALHPMGWGINLLLALARWTQDLPYAQLFIPAMPTLSLGLICLGGLSLCLLRGHIRFNGLVFISLAMGWHHLVPQSDILLSSTGSFQAVRLNAVELSFSNLRNASFIRENWTKQWGGENDQAQPFDKIMACDQQGCLYEHQKSQLRVIFNRKPLSLNEDCLKADILITSQNSPIICEYPELILGKEAFKKNGAHALYLGKGGIRIDTDRAHRGKRPWTIYGE